MKILEKLDVELNLNKLKKRISHQREQWLEEIIGSALNDCRIEPKAVYEFFPCRVNKGSIDILEKKFHSRLLAKRFKHAKEVGIFIVTIGDGIERISRDAFDNEKDYLKGFVYDAVGSEYAESLAQALHKLLEKEKGYCMSRLSPGYGDWHISEQGKLFELVPGDRIGVRLTDSFIMLPEKSVSAMIGFSDRKSKGCEDCDKTECAYRTILPQTRTK